MDFNDICFFCDDAPVVKVDDVYHAEYPLVVRFGGTNGRFVKLFFKSEDVATDFMKNLTSEIEARS